MLKVCEKIKIKTLDKSIPKVKVIILDMLPPKHSFKGEILGRKLKDWVAFACRGFDIKILENDTSKKPFEIIKDHVDKKFDYTLLLFAYTPLLEKNTISSIIEYASVKNINLCKLPVGYIFNNKYFSESQMQVDSVYSQNLDEFYIVENKKQYTFALQVLQERINQYHMSQGVDIINPKSVYIEPEVDIGSGVEIHSNNTLKGNSIISNNVILKENNVITNSKINANSCISGSVINASIIGRQVYIASFCEINNSLIGDDTTIGNGSYINNYKVDEKQKIVAKTILGERDEGDNRTGKSG